MPVNRPSQVSNPRLARAAAIGVVRFALNLTLFTLLVVVAFHVALAISIWSEDGPALYGADLCLAMMSGFAVIMGAWAVTRWATERQQSRLRRRRSEVPARGQEQPWPDRPPDMARLQRPGARHRHRRTVGAAQRGAAQQDLSSRDLSSRDLSSRRRPSRDLAPRGWAEETG